jgi:hypothetical protein
MKPFSALYHKLKMQRSTTIIIFWISAIALTKAQTHCDFVNKIQGYQQSIELNWESTSNIDSIFNLHGYLSMFDKVKVAPGLKSYFHHDGIDGSPILYVIPENFNLMDTIKKRVERKIEKKYLRSSLGLVYLDPSTPKPDTVGNYENQKLLHFHYLHDSTNRISHYMIPDNSDEGFLQYLFFHTMGEQFALYWHANYDEKKIICSDESLNGLINVYKRSRAFEVDKKKLKSSKVIDTRITISSTDKKYFLTWYELETHKGFYRRTYEIDRDPPYKIRLQENYQIFEIRLNFVY